MNDLLPSVCKCLVLLIYAICCRFSNYTYREKRASRSRTHSGPVGVIQTCRWVRRRPARRPHAPHPAPHSLASVPSTQDQHCTLTKKTDRDAARSRHPGSASASARLARTDSDKLNAPRGRVAKGAKTEARCLNTEPRSSRPSLLARASSRPAPPRVREIGVYARAQYRRSEQYITPRTRAYGHGPPRATPHVCVRTYIAFRRGMRPRRRQTLPLSRAQIAYSPA